MKKILVIVGLCALVGYLIFAVFYFGDKPKEGICNRFDIVMSNDSAQNMINVVDIEKLVDSKGLNPYGKQLKDIDTYAIEQIILSNKSIKSANVYTTGAGDVKAVLQVKTPILRVMTDNESYYVDNDAQIMPLSRNQVVYLPLATGAISKEFAQKELYQFANFLMKNEFWNAQIEQINVLQNGEVELIPRVGNQKILLGKLEDYNKKLDKLYTFYRKAMNEVGWNKYSEINLKYEKQVVCTKQNAE